MGLPGDVFETAALAASRGEYQKVEALLEAVPKGVLLENAELSLLLASAKTRVFKHSEAKELLLSAEPVVRASGNDWLLRRWQNGYAVQLLHEGSLSNATEVLHECLSSAEIASQHRLLAYLNNTLGILAAHLGDVEKALHHFRRSIASWQQIGNTHRVGFGYFNMAVLNREWGRTAEAAGHFLLAQEYLGTLKSKEERVLVRSERGLLLLALGDSVLAERTASTAVAESSDLKVPLLTAVANRALGTTLTVKGDFTAARRILMRAKHAIEATRNLLARAEVYEELAILNLLDEREEEADWYRKRAETLFIEIGSQRHQQRFVSRFASVAVTKKIATP